MRKLHFIDTRAVVGNIDDPVFAVLSDMGLNGAAFRTVVDGIADNVVKGAVQIAFVGTDHGIFRDFRINAQGNALIVLVGNALVVLNQVSQERNEFEVFFSKGILEVSRRERVNNSPTKVSMRTSSPSSRLRYCSCFCG